MIWVHKIRVSFASISQFTWVKFEPIRPGVIYVKVYHIGWDQSHLIEMDYGFTYIYQGQFDCLA